MKDSSWKDQPERGSLILIKMLLWVALHLGRSASRFWLYPITAYFLIAARTARRASHGFLRRVLQREPTWLEQARHFHCFSSVILDRVFLLSGRVEVFDIQIHNKEVLFDIVRSGRGCLLFGSHLGSFEVMRATACDFDLKVKVLMYREQNQQITTVLDALNPKIASSVIPLGDHNSMLMANEFVQHGGVLGILCDRTDDSDKVTQCDFMGSAVNFPAGPVIMAAAMEVPVVMMFGLYRGGNRYDIHFELLSDGIKLPRESRQEQIRYWMQAYANTLQKYVMHSPYNWFNFYDYWHEEA